MDKLYIIIPAYNEEATIRAVIDEWYPMVVMAGAESRLVIINDGSRDKTLKTAENEAKSKPQLIVKDKENSGHGATILAGYKFAVEQGADFVFQTDSDGQTRASEFPDFWRMRRQYDMLIGCRNKRQDGILRIFVTKILKLVVLMCFHVSVKDANTPFRLMDAKILAKKIKLVPKDFFLTNVLLTVIYTKHKCRVKFIPITFRPRQGGVNSINMRRIFGIGKNALKDFYRLNKAIDVKEGEEL